MTSQEGDTIFTSFGEVSLTTAANADILSWHAFISLYSCGYATVPLLGNDHQRSTTLLVILATSAPDSLQDHSNC